MRPFRHVRVSKVWNGGPVWMNCEMSPFSRERMHGRGC